MSLEKFKLLCWKNFTLQKRHPIAALFEIGFPILVVLIFAFAKNQVDPQRIAQQEFTSFEPEKYRSCQYFDDSYSRLGVYSGGNLKLEDLVNSSVGKKSKWQVEVFGNLSSLDNFLTNENGTLGIEFQGNNDVSSLEIKIVYKFDTDFVYFKRNQINYQKN